MRNCQLHVELLHRDNWNDILKLSVATNQKNFIESSSKCLDDAKNDAYDMKWSFYGVYSEITLIGFAMHARQGHKIIPSSKVWLDRYMIDEKYQGKGYGKQALMLIIDMLFSDYNCNKLYLSVHADNIPAIILYEKLGFNKTRFKDPQGELIMRLAK